MTDYFVVGQRYIITCDNWFLAPDGKSYKGVFGVVLGIHNIQESLGVKVNPRSADWYVVIGKKTPVTIAGCQIHFAVKSNQCCQDETIQDWTADASNTNVYRRPNSIFFAD